MDAAARASVPPFLPGGAMVTRQPLLLTAVLAALSSYSSAWGGEPATSSRFATLPVSFVENQGQEDARTLFTTRAGSSLLYFTHQGVVWRFEPPNGDQAVSPPTDVRIGFVGAVAKPRVEGRGRQSARFNYFCGSDPRGWRTNVAAYDEIVYLDLYDGIDLVYRGDAGRVKYEFVVAPGADPGRIALDYVGVDSASVEPDGSLRLECPGLVVRELAPVIFQQVGGARTEVKGSFRVDAIGEKRWRVRFEIGPYDRAHRLVIDPTLAHSTYYGGSASDECTDVATGPDGSVCFCGNTFSNNLPLVNPIQAAVGAAFVAKLDPTGTSLVFATYIGGAFPQTTHAYGIAVDSAGAIYLTGDTGGTQFPTVNPIQPNYGGPMRDAFLIKLSPTGDAIVYATYLGGGYNDWGKSIAVDAAGSAYVLGWTESMDFPRVNPFQATLRRNDLFVTKANPGGTAWEYSTLLGGSLDDWCGDGKGIAVDASGSASVVGYGWSTDFPTLNPFQSTNRGGMWDGYVARLSPAGNSIIYGSYVGGSGTDKLHAVAVEPNGVLHACGSTGSADFPVLNALQSTFGGSGDGVYFRVSPTGALLYSTYIGVPNSATYESAYGVAVDALGQAYLSGEASVGFPEVNPLSGTRGWGSDFFVMKLNVAGNAIRFSTLVGGSNHESDGWCALDPTGGLAVGGNTSSTNFPTRNPVQATVAGSGDGVVFRVTFDPPSAPVLLSPSNGAQTGASIVPLDWQDAVADDGVQGYRVEVDDDGAFPQPLAWSGSPTASNVTTGILAFGTWFWRVRAVDNLGRIGPWSQVWSFTRADSTPPPAPTLLAAPDGANLPTATPLLDWSDVADPSGVVYEVQVDENAAFDAPLLYTVAGLAVSEQVLPWIGDGVTRYWRVRAVDGSGNVGPWSAVFSFTVDRGVGFYVGRGQGGAGWIDPCLDAAGGWAFRSGFQDLVGTYNSANGATRPAAGDFDGDGRSEVVVGRGSYGADGGWLAVVEDSGSSLSLLRWIRVPWTNYNAANGETWPACGDVDGDGRDEIVVGLGSYPSAGGWFVLFDDASADFALLGWRRVPWAAYNAVDGEMRPAVGDLDGDGAAEVIAGFASYPSQGGRIARFTSGAVDFAGWLQFHFGPYNVVNGETWPSCGDVDGDGLDELCIGQGPYTTNGGWVEFLDDAARGYASLGWKRVPWPRYNGLSGEVRPSVGQLVEGGAEETVLGLGTYRNAGGWMPILGGAPGFSVITWRRLPDIAYDAANGETRPSVRR